MELEQGDLNELLLELTVYTKKFVDILKEGKEDKKIILMLKENLKIVKESEEKLSQKLKQKHNNIIQLQEHICQLTNTKAENDALKNEIKNLKELLEQERSNFHTEKESWNIEKDSIHCNNNEEIENIKKIRDMEVTVLNREITRIQEVGLEKAEYFKKEAKRTEEEHKKLLSQTISNYEEMLSKANRDLISAQCELRNLKHLSVGAPAYNVLDGRGIKDRNIPQPLSFSRFKTPAPTVSTGSELLQDYAVQDQLITETSNPVQLQQVEAQTTKRRKLYTPATDNFYML